MRHYSYSGEGLRFYFFLPAPLYTIHLAGDKYTLYTM